jgi:hypothetical protein
MSHKHLFTPHQWCMVPYTARKGITRRQFKSDPGLESMILDQYVRDCGFEPTDSWVMVVRPSGECEFTPLRPDEPRWCCEREEEIEAGLRGATPIGPPPYLAARSTRRSASSARPAGDGPAGPLDISASED